MKLEAVLGAWVGPRGLEVTIEPDGVRLRLPGLPALVLDGAEVTEIERGWRMEGALRDDDVVVRLTRRDGGGLHLSWVDAIGPSGSYELARPHGDDG